MKSERILSFDEILVKLEGYCAYQERCSFEVLNKAKSFGLGLEDCKKILALLIDKKFVDDLRFAHSYTAGKFRFKKWGRAKIKFELKQKNLPDALINEAIAALDDEEYLASIRELAERKWREAKGTSNYEKKAKVFRYLQSKGFESGAISKVLGELDVN